jgi:hypothetical protein
MKRLIVLGMLVALALVGCAPAGSSPPASGGSGGPSVTQPSLPTNEPSPSADYKVTYGFAVPSTTVTVAHTVNPPPLPYLVGIYDGDHPEGTPTYQRISFYFRVGFPTYAFGYVPSVLSEGRGEPIPSSGNAFLRIGFIQAQAHDNAGHSTVTASPPNQTGLTTLSSYGSAGDFEGHLTYGLGIQTAPNSDQVMPIRTGELKKPDGSGGFFYVVHFDVQSA